MLGNGVKSEELGYRLLDIRNLDEGISLELLGIEILTSAELQGLLVKRVANGVVDLEPRLVDDVVECCSCKVTQENGLRIGSRFQSPKGVGYGMMPIVRETGCQRRDIQ